ncbi:hypothetical protein JG687_00006201 [Phytophthora cactorum]|uniref:Ubiquitin-like protease family profile domain-containing protein n=1 Tax=Phytophthora cactorum TaxID=29920 RepID=A0A8T1UIT2_9STRA|nr:hypothetical protein JG687_00006201 [Phytophthora cactorum]
MGSVDAKFKDEGAAEIPDKALGSWPCAHLEGFGNSWFNDNLVAAFVKRLANKYSNNTTIFLPTLKTPTSARGKRIPPPTLSLVVGATEQFVFMPLNINSSHWTCLVLDSATKTIYCYDSMDKRSHHNLLE